NAANPFALHLTRRTFLRRSGVGLGSVALASLLNGRTAAASNTSLYKGVILPRHHAPRAKRVIFLTMAGGPSHLETFDYKPKLAELSGKPMPESVTKGQPIAQLQNTAKLTCLAPQHAFQKCGRSGQQI